MRTASDEKDYRRHPRIPTRRAIELELRTQASTLSLGANKTDRKTFAVTTADISREGLGVFTPASDEIGPGASVTVTLVLSGRTLKVPAHIAWAKAAPGNQRLAGLRLHTEVLDSMSRRAFDGWVAETERAHLGGTGR